MSLRVTLGAWARSLLVFAAAFDAPLAGPAAAALTPDPRSEETVFGGAPATLYEPGRNDDRAAIVLLNGATEQGRHHPRVVALAAGLARAGYPVLVPDVPGIVRGVVTIEGARSVVECSLELSSRARAERVGLVGVSAGTTLALLAAVDEALAERVAIVAGVTGYTDLTELLRLATTGTYLEGAEPVRYRPEPFLSLCVARSVCSGLESERSRGLLEAALEAVAPDDPDPIAPLRGLDTVGADAEASAMVALLVNRDPERFDELYAALPETMRAKIDRLSPIRWADRLQVPVELLFDPRDKYFPLEHARALQRVSPRVRVTVTHALAHADPRVSLRGAKDALHVFGFVTRALERLGSAAPLEPSRR